jgi:hypothetical protein
MILPGSPSSWGEVFEGTWFIGVIDHASRNLEIRLKISRSFPVDFANGPSGHFQSGFTLA